MFSSQICTLNLYASLPLKILTILCFMDLIFHWVKKKISRNLRKLMGIHILWESDCWALFSVRVSWKAWSKRCARVCVSYSILSNSLRPRGLYSSPGSSAHRILQAIILEWVAIPFSKIMITIIYWGLSMCQTLSQSDSWPTVSDLILTATPRSRDCGYHRDTEAKLRGVSCLTDKCEHWNSSF